MAIQAWTEITAAMTDTDSSIDEFLMTALREDLINLRQAAYGQRDELGFHTPIWGHNHDGQNSAATNFDATGDGSEAIGAGAQWTPAAGIWQIIHVGSNENEIRLEIFESAAWRIGHGNGYAIVYSDGSTIRFNNITGGQLTVYYQTFD